MRSAGWEVGRELGRYDAKHGLSPYITRHRYQSPGAHRAARTTGEAIRWRVAFGVARLERPDVRARAAFRLGGGGAVYTVNTTAITGGLSANCVSGVGACTLPDAITAASGATTDVTIALQASTTYTLTAVDNTDSSGPSGLPNYTGGTGGAQTLTLQGNGATITRSSAAGTPAFRLLHATGFGSTLAIQNLTASNGDAGGGSGGGIFAVNAMTVANSTITGNHTNGTPTTGGVAGNGGGIYAGTLTVTDSTFTGNTANGISDGGTDQSGGSGGGIFAFGTATVTNSTITGNHIDGTRNGGDGAGIFAFGTMTVTNSTITDNHADTAANFGGRGGGFVAFGTATVTNSIIIGNTLVAPSPGYGADIFSYAAVGFDPASTHNLSNDVKVLFAVTAIPGSTHVASFAFATPLQDNGGPTATLAIPLSGLAYQGGDLPTCQSLSVTGVNGTTYTGATAVDQRGAARIVAAKCSIGAFEPGQVQTVAALTPSIPSPTYGQSLTLTATISGLLGGSPGDGTVAFTKGGMPLAGCALQAVTTGGTATCAAVGGLNVTGSPYSFTAT